MSQIRPFNVVLLGFGGPATRSDVRPFLDRVLRGRPIPPERYDAIVSHYGEIGGRSPFNDLTRRQGDAVMRELRRRGVRASVRTAYLYSAPFVSDVAAQLARDTESRTVAVVLAVHQSALSWDRYLGLIPNATYVPPYYDHPLFVEAQAGLIREALYRMGKTSFDGVEVIFSAHSIPQSVADAGAYAAQFERSARLIAEHLGEPSWRLAYQSRSGAPAERWLEPDVRDVILSLGREKHSSAIVAPIGFVCDNVEVLYDIDVAAARIARALRVQMERAGALNDHPLFVRMVADLVIRCAA